MGAAATKAVGNVYYEARKKAAMYNDRLSSREGAAEALGISPSTLADYELGLTKFVPVENVIRMADVYNAPQLKPHYCKNVCPIGCEMPVATEETSIELATLRMLKALDEGKIDEVKDRLVEIASDGVIDDDEKADFKKIMGFLDKLSHSISEIRIIAEKGCCSMATRWPRRTVSSTRKRRFRTTSQSRLSYRRTALTSFAGWMTRRCLSRKTVTT